MHRQTVGEKMMEIAAGKMLSFHSLCDRRIAAVDIVRRKQ